jgi:hypothetical protein
MTETEPLIKILNKESFPTKTLIVNLFAGPGSGKSTLRAGVFYELKIRSILCEEAYEYAKDLIWESRRETFDDQIYIFGKQYHRIFRLIGKVDVVITDCPIILSTIYDPDKRKTLEALIIEEHLKMWTYNVFVHRNKPYNSRGRNQIEQDARKIDCQIAAFLDDHNIPFEVVEGDASGKDSIVRKILLLLNK